MIPLAHLWAPILASAVLVFVVSSLVHMVFKWHNPDYRGLPNEDAVRKVIRDGDPAPGQYVLPYCAEMKEMGSEAMLQKYKEGPVGFLLLRPSGAPTIGTSLVQWFLFSVGVSLSAAYLASRTLPAGTAYLQVFRIAGTVAFLAYSGNAFTAAIWWGRPWGSALKEVGDALLYALATGGAFGWLWPR